MGYDLLNFNRHGFDAKNSKTNKFLEVKQCSIFSNSLGGTWNDTNEEKAKASSDKKLISFEKQTVLDPFMGSGSTGIGGLDLDREFIRYELEKEYFNIAKQRMENKQNDLKYSLFKTY